MRGFLLLVAVTLAGCVDADQPVVCASGDLECFYAHLSVREANGTNAKFLEVDTAALDAGMKSAPTPAGPFTAWAVGTQILGFDGAHWFTDFTLPAGEKLSGVWGTSRDDVWAVGSANNHQAIYHRSAAGWSAVDAGAPIDQAGFSDVWASAPNDAWAVGGSPSGGLLAHWDGAGWTTAVKGRGITSISGVRADDVWVADGVEVRHWNGTTWSVSRTSPFATGTGLVHATGTSDAWAMQWGSGPATAVHWNGLAWSEVPSGTSALSANGYNAGGLWSTGQDLWVSGKTTSGQGTVSHRSGSSWTDATGVTFGGWMYGIFGTGPGDVWVTGEHGEHPISHWDGQAWRQFVTPGVAVYDVWASAPTVLGGGGGVPAISNQPAALTFDSWTDAHTLELQWTDPNPCRPGFCFSLCRVASLSCFARSLCTEPFRDGQVTGSSHFLVSAAAQPASTDEALVLRVTPLSSPDCNPYDELATADIGTAIEVNELLRAPVDAGSATGGGGGGSGTGGGGGSSSGLCAHWTCGSSSQCAAVNGGANGVQCLFEPGQTCQQWCALYFSASNCTCQ